MGKTRGLKPIASKPKPAKSQPPDHLTMRLFAPGMTIMHRAGLGGLVCTLEYIERARRRGALTDDEVPGGPWPAGKPPWEVDDQTATLHFGRPDAAGEYLRRLFALAFQTKNGLIYLPGQYGTEPSLGALVSLQLGLTLSFLQFGPHRALGPPTDVQVEFDGSGSPTIVAKSRPCTHFVHQAAFSDLIDAKGCMTRRAVEVIGAFHPGAIIRHNAFKSDSSIEEHAETIVPLFLAPIGCLSLPVNPVTGALIVPENDSLRGFSAVRPLMTPTTVRECYVANAEDGALQAMVRLRATQLARSFGVPRCYAMTMRPTAWASKQKSRVATMAIEGDNRDLDRFEVALAELPPKVVVRRSVETKGRGKSKRIAERCESFRVDSVVRPLIAENLARRKPWYERFADLMTKLDANNNPLREKVCFEKKGLHAMTENPDMWDDHGEAAIVQAVHEALRNRYGRIAEENKGSPVTMKRRFGGEYDRWRLAFAGSKTADQLRATMCDLFSRAGNNAVLRESWREVVPFLTTRWQLARDLALLALASYQGRGGDGEGGVEASKSVDNSGESP